MSLGMLLAASAMLTGASGGFGLAAWVGFRITATFRAMSVVASHGVCHLEKLGSRIHLHAIQQRVVHLNAELPSKSADASHTAGGSLDVLLHVTVTASDEVAACLTEATPAAGFRLCHWVRCVLGVVGSPVKLDRVGFYPTLERIRTSSFPLGVNVLGWPDRPIPNFENKMLLLMSDI